METLTNGRKGGIFSLIAAYCVVRFMKTKCDFWVPITCRGTRQKRTRAFSLAILVFEQKLNRTMV